MGSDERCYLESGGSTPLGGHNMLNFRLVPKSVTLDDLERRNGRSSVISPNSIAFWAYYVKVIEDTLILSAAEM